MGRTLRLTTEVATAKSQARKISAETRKIKSSYTTRRRTRTPTPPPDSAPPTAPSSPVASSSGSANAPPWSSRRVTMPLLAVPRPAPQKNIGKKVFALDHEERKVLARKIIGCTARGNAFAADIMRRQVAEIEHRERMLWETRRWRDERLAADQLDMLRKQRYSDAEESESDEESLEIDFDAGSQE